jgi:perosamine synthetase
MAQMLDGGWETLPELSNREPIPEVGKMEQIEGKDSWIKDLETLPDEDQMVLTAGPSIGPLEIAYSEQAVRAGWNSQHSTFLATFESEFADFVGAKFALATSSCTGALHLSLLAAGVGPGDEVIVPDLTWVATGSAVEYVGAIPVFVDVDKDSWTISPAAVRAAISPQTKAIIPVHLYGVPSEMGEIGRISEEFGLALIEDAAPAIGATWDGQNVGTFGDFGCFSFQGAKMLVTGEGGMLVTNSKSLFDKAKKLQEHGRRPGTFWIESLGYKYKMSNVQAAIGLGQIRRVNNQIERKNRVNEWYRAGLANVSGVKFQTAKTESRSIDWMTSIELTGAIAERRDELMKFLGERGVDTRPVFPQMSSFGFWAGPPQTGNVVSERIAARSMNLPSSVNLRKNTIHRICEAIGSFSEIRG